MCIFCKIINGEIPSKKVYEDDDVLAILDISQATKGHTLVMSKKHYANLFEIDNNVYLKVMAKVKELALKITEKENALGCNILNNCNEVTQYACLLCLDLIINMKDLKTRNTSTGCSQCTQS